ncbi:helix-turn-helix transcriptional regulator [Methylobacterium sp. Leaf117]|uniref:helix-turn-helix domain-containing protein n=1 Tax=Methylobacterium sp. Leaf117 TaxID=1736260 RepID=UPI0006F58902|nr:helix-turn-helix transcriptional regulator [Methylobacterium sp. Leaf117]KQP90775.1 hypothetical protein ASF57_23500 [Methylobacterium sp. Leaf117]
MITNSQCRAARALIGVTQGDLAEWAQVSQGTIAKFEGGLRTPFAPNLAALQRALEEHGVVFLPATDDRGPGVCLASPTA